MKYRPPLSAYKPSTPEHFNPQERLPLASRAAVGGRPVAQKNQRLAHLAGEEVANVARAGSDVSAVVLHLLWHPARLLRCRARWTAVDAPPGLVAVERQLLALELAR